ncbi:MAG: MotA/TolQ/ExbB proton channel family protein [Lachnospiraceae bacterium]|nr:MotA/TolQ/ExbB proton channel family protein [Lachnospiraceae bacterium]
MGNKKWYEWLLTLVYIAMIGVFVYLNLFTDQKEDIASIVVNIVMFIVVAVIFFNCEKSSFNPTNNVIVDLRRVTEMIRADAMGSHEFLWKKYKDSKEEIFENKILKEQFRDYCDEIKRIEHSNKPYYKCDIEDYISYELTDELMHRNMLAQVAGAMTGLGILGTFIGLSLGLQSFNTGTTEEITNSITPLMDGIKVAFHTSIYGMVFSLTFNYAFKRKTDEAEKAVREFVGAFKKYVLPDTSNDGINRLIDLQLQQTEAINSLADSVGDQLYDSLRMLLEPQFDKFNKTITDFGNMATQNQLDALSKVVDEFIDKMNKSLDNSFTNLKYTIDQTYVAQQANAKQIVSILNTTEAQAENYRNIEKQTASIIKSLEVYTKDVRGVLAEFDKNMDLLTKIAQNSEDYIDKEQQYAGDLRAYHKSLDNTATTFTVKLREQQALLNDIRSAVIRMPDDINNTFRVVDENLVDVEKHFHSTIVGIKKATDSVPQVVEQAYGSLDKACNNAARAVNELSETVDQLSKELHRTQIGRR